MWFTQDEAPEAPWLNHRLDALLSLLYGHEVRYPELCLGVTAVGWGGWLLNPFGDAFHSTPTFRVMLLIAPEEMWGLVVVVFGLCLLYGIWRQSRYYMRLGTLSLCIYWLIVTVSIVFSNWQGTGVVAYIGYAWLNALAYLRLSSAKL